MRKIGSSSLKRRQKIFRVKFLPQEFLSAANDLFGVLNKRRILYMAVGALPVNVYGRERTSRDLDIAMTIDKGMFRDLFPSSRYLLVYPDKIEEISRVAKVRDKRTGILIDLLLSPEEFSFNKDSFKRRRKVLLGKRFGYIPSVEDYVISKLKAARAGSNDFQDIISVMLKNSRKIDWRYLERRARAENKLYLLNYYKELVRA